MKKLIFISFLFVRLIGGAQEKSTPFVKDYGTVYTVPNATILPDPNLNYKILVDVNTASEKPNLLNESLETVAKLLNLHILGGVPKEKLHVDLIVHGPAIVTLLNNKAYQQKFEIDNPNLGLLAALDKAGVKIMVCGQTMQKRNIEKQQLSSEVKIAFSAITTISNYAINGYSVLKY